MRRLISVSFLIAGILISMAVTAEKAHALPTCLKTDPLTGVCLVAVQVPGDPKPISDDKPRSSRTGGNPGCVLDGSKVPCRHNGGIWSNAHRCYLKRVANQPPKSDPSWEGHSNGAVYHCFQADDNDTYQVWLATAPGAAPPPDPRVLARQAIQSMQLHAIEIGIVPEPRPDRIGVIGLPTWMWADGPDQHTWGPITRTASAGGYTVTATGRVQRVVWAMGDGSTVVCAKRGTPYADSFGKRPSPDCGHRYTRQGRYTVRATSYWVVEWAGIGQSGTIPMNFTSTAAITMGEVQVLSR